MIKLLTTSWTGLGKGFTISRSARGTCNPPAGLSLHYLLFSLWVKALPHPTPSLRQWEEMVRMYISSSAHFDRRNIIRSSQASHALAMRHLMNSSCTPKGEVLEDGGGGNQPKSGRASAPAKHCVCQNQLPERLPHYPPRVVRHQWLSYGYRPHTSGTT